MKKFVKKAVLSISPIKKLHQHIGNLVRKNQELFRHI